MIKLIFLAIASAILVFTMIAINNSPIISLGASSWSTLACNSLSDKYDDLKKNGAPEENLKHQKKEIKRCKNKKGMVGLEYAALIINLVFGFMCALLGYQHFLNVGNMGKCIGLFGLGAGVVSFVLTLAYVIESVLVFSDIEESSTYSYYHNMRINSDGAYLELKDGKYFCIFYKEDDQDSVYLRYSDYGNKYLSYNKEHTYPEDEKLTFSGCLDYQIQSWDDCKDLDKGTTSIPKKTYTDASGATKDCDFIYYSSSPTDNSRKVLYDRWLTSLIFSCLIILLNIGLALFGFLLFIESRGSSGQDNNQDNKGNIKIKEKKNKRRGSKTKK